VTAAERRELALLSAAARLGRATLAEWPWKMSLEEHDAICARGYLSRIAVGMHRITPAGMARLRALEARARAPRWRRGLDLQPGDEFLLDGMLCRVVAVGP
jgi:hypothetical protein